MYSPCRFQSQSSGLRFGTFVFGPVVMRYFHLVNKPQEALALLKNPKTVGMFDQHMSYQILMDLLLESKMYNEVYETFLLAQERSINGNKFPKNCVILVLAALFRTVWIISTILCNCLIVIHFVFLEHTRKLRQDETVAGRGQSGGTHPYAEVSYLCRWAGTQAKRSSNSPQHSC